MSKAGESLDKIARLAVLAGVHDFGF